MFKETLERSTSSPVLLLEWKTELVPVQRIIKSSSQGKATHINSPPFQESTTGHYHSRKAPPWSHFTGSCNCTRCLCHLIPLLPFPFLHSLFFSLLAAPFTHTEIRCQLIIIHLYSPLLLLSRLLPAEGPNLSNEFNVSRLLPQHGAH